MQKIVGIAILLAAFGVTGLFTGEVKVGLILIAAAVVAVTVGVLIVFVLEGAASLVSPPPRSIGDPKNKKSSGT